MVKHVLMIKLKDNSKEQCEKLRDLFMTMKGRVPQALDVEAGLPDRYAREPRGARRIPERPVPLQHGEDLCCDSSRKGGCGRLHRLIEQNSRGAVRLLHGAAFLHGLLLKSKPRQISQKRIGKFGVYTPRKRHMGIELQHFIRYNDS